MLTLTTVVPARGGAEVALGLCYIFFSSIELACAMRRPGPCVRALCQPAAPLLSKNMTCARRGAMQRQANTFITLRTALFTPRTPHFTLALHTPHFRQLISSELFSSHFMLSHMSAKFFLTIFLSSEHSSTFLISPKLVSTHLGSSALCTSESLRHRCIYTDESLQNTLYYKDYKACTKHVPVLLCTTKRARSTGFLPTTNPPVTLMQPLQCYHPPQGFCTPPLPFIHFL